MFTEVLGRVRFERIWNCYTNDLTIKGEVVPQSNGRKSAYTLQPARSFPKMTMLSPHPETNHILTLINWCNGEGNTTKPTPLIKTPPCLLFLEKRQHRPSNIRFTSPSVRGLSQAVRHHSPLTMLNPETQKL